MDNPKLNINGILLILFGGIFLIVGGSFYLNERKFLQNAITRQARVVEIRDIFGTAKYCPVVEFTDHKDLVIQAAVSTCPQGKTKYSINQQVSVQYNKNNPYDLRFKVNPLQNMLVSIAGISMFFTGLSLTIYTYIKAKQM